MVDFVNDLFSSKSVYPEIEVAHKNYLFVVFDRHSSVSEVVLKGALKDLGYHFISLAFPPPAADQMAVDRHKCLVINLEPNAHRALVASGAVVASLDLADLK